MNKRLPPHTFNIPVERIREGFFSDKYFSRTRDILRMDGNDSSVVMQVFARQNGVLCGIDEAIAVIRLCADSPEELKISALYDGDRVSKNETVLCIEGAYRTFAHLETVYLGVLARGTSVATGVRRTIEAAAGKTVLFFSSRFDHYTNQSGDGYAAFIGGAHGVSTDANGLYTGTAGTGTIPHGLIAAYNGSTVEACRAFSEHAGPDVRLIALVDFENDCIRTSLEAARRFASRLWGVRLDTAGDMRDVSVRSRGDDSYGVCPELVFKLREALDEEGFGHVRIVLSGGFDEAKLAKFMELGVPFDAVGVGSAYYRLRIDFTADVVMVNGRHCAKAGRVYNPNPRLRENC